MWTKKLTLITLLLCPLLLWGQKKEFKQALKENTVAGYTRFLNNYPESKFTGEVENARDNLCQGLWQKTDKSKIASLEKYLKECPHSGNRSQAETLIAELQEEIKRQQAKAEEDRQWQEAQNLHTKSAYEGFLAKYPDSEFKDMAKQNISKFVADSLARFSWLDPDATLKELIDIGKKYESEGDAHRESAVKASKSGLSTNEIIKMEVEAYENSIVAYTAALKKDPNNADILRHRGMTYAKQDQDGNQSIVMGNFGSGGPWAMAEFGPESLVDLNKAVKLEPHQAENYMTRGKVHLMYFQNKYTVWSQVDAATKQMAESMLKPNLDDATQAVSDFKMAAKLNPKLCDAYYEMGRLYFMCLRMSKAAEAFEQADACGLDQDQSLIAKLREVGANPLNFFTQELLDEFPLE